MDAVLGIDIGKAKFHVTLLLADGTRRRKACGNSPTGCAELLAWMTRHGATHVHAEQRIEATDQRLKVADLARQRRPGGRVFLRRIVGDDIGIDRIGLRT